MKVILDKTDIEALVAKNYNGKIVKWDKDGSLILELSV